MRIIRREPRWRAVEITFNEIGRDTPHLPAVEDRRANAPLHDVDNAYHHGCLARPFQPPDRASDGPTFGDDRCKPGLARVALADRVRGNQPKDAAGLQQPESAAEEMCDDVGVAVRA